MSPPESDRTKVYGARGEPAAWCVERLDSRDGQQAHAARLDLRFVPGIRGSSHSVCDRTTRGLRIISICRIRRRPDEEFLVRVTYTPALFALALPPALPLHAQTFTPVASPDIAAHVSFSTGVTWVDWDQDGDLDLFVVTGFAPNNDNVLYRNDGGDTFHRVLGVPLVQD